MTKWDTIQADVADQYAYLDEVEVEAEDEGDVFGFSKAIELDHLTDKQIDTLLTTIDWN
jgi:predicted DNA binding protein